MDGISELTIRLIDIVDGLPTGQNKGKGGTACHPQAPACMRICHCDEKAQGSQLSKSRKVASVSPGYWRIGLCTSSRLLIAFADRLRLLWSKPRLPAWTTSFHSLLISAPDPCQAIANPRNGARHTNKGALRCLFEKQRAISSTD